MEKKEKKIESSMINSKNQIKKLIKKQNDQLTIKSTTIDKCFMDQTLELLLKKKDNKEEFTSIETTNTINDLIRHVRTNCLKCPKDSAYLMIGCYYFELFKSRLFRFKNLILDKELSIFNQNKDKESNKNWDNVKIRNCDTFNDLINLDSQRKILEYLFKLIDIWKKLLDVKEKLKIDLIIQLDVFEILKNCYFIFTFYGAIKYIKLTCQIYLEFVLLHGQQFKNHLLFAYYCQIRFCLDYGLLNKAKNYLKTGNSIINNLTQKHLKYLIIEIKLIKVLEFELKLLLNEDLEQTANELKLFLEDDYFQNITCISGYIKCLGYFLSTKFNAKLYSNQDLYHFFNESFCFTKSILSKWYPYLIENTEIDNFKKIIINSPIWLEFAVCKFTLEFSLSYYYYSVNCSVVDIHFYFNILVIKLARIYCSLLWLSRNLILSTYYEKPEVQKVKINQVKNLFISKKKCDLNIKDVQQQPIKINKTKILGNNNQISNQSTENESVTIHEESLDMRTKEYANCSHNEETPIYLLKKSMLKNPTLNEESFEIIYTNYDYNKELADLDDYFIPDLIIVKQELLLLLYLYNESKQSFLNYLKQLDLDAINTIFFECLANSLNVNFGSLNRNHQNLITSNFNMRCLLIYLENIDLSNSLIIELTRNVLKKSTNLGHSYEIHCFIAELVIYYVNSLFKEIFNGKLNIIDYDYLECEKYLIKPLISNSPIKKRVLRSRIKPDAPKKVRNYKMDEIKDYIQEMYDLNCQKNSVKLNFTSSDEEEKDDEKDKENLKLKINKLKSIKNDDDNLNENDKFEIKKTTTMKRNKSTFIKEKKKLLNNNNQLNDDLNSLNERICNLNLDDTLDLNDNKNYEFLINESTNDHLTEFRMLLHRVLDLFGKFPSIKHFNEINKILFKLSICKDSKFNDESAYYFSEYCQANALRFKTIEQIKKKRKYTSINYDTRVLQFNNQIDNKADELNRMLDILPKTWRIIQIQFIDSINNKQSDLFITRYQRNKDPIILKINVNSEKLCTNFTKEFNEIIQLSNETVKEEDSKSFWKLRFALDQRLKKLLNDVNSAWINCFIGIFLGECSDYENMFKGIGKKISKYAKDNNLICLNSHLLKVICESFIYLKEESFNHSMVTLFEPKNRFENLYDDCLEVVKEHIKFNSLEDLREIVSEKIKFGPVGLITGSALENFPFESLFCLRMLNLEVFRVPSIRFLNWMYVNLRRTNERVKNGVSDKKVFYLINPSNNLTYTEHFFKIKFEKLKDEELWDGFIGEIPDQSKLQKALQNNDIYIYFGHNSGVRYLGKLHECNVNCLSLVIGCSSAALSNQDQMVEAFGSSYYFLINGCPTYLGCLWNVTDRDIDRFAERLLRHTFRIYDLEDGNNNIEKCASIAKAVALSRNICRLKYLNGSAPVIRGLPISMKFD